jgi:hypothetical protein
MDLEWTPLDQDENEKIKHLRVSGMIVYCLGGGHQEGRWNWRGGEDLSVRIWGIWNYRRQPMMSSHLVPSSSNGLDGSHAVAVKSTQDLASWSSSWSDLGLCVSYRSP